jgi:cytochrome c oxidase subunit 3
MIENNSYKIPEKHNEQHPFHLVDPSPWPLLTSLAILALVQSIAMYFHYFLYSENAVIFSLIYLVFNLCCWFSDIVTEATFEGHHTKEVQRNILLGMLLFITSEIMFFF